MEEKRERERETKRKKRESWFGNVISLCIPLGCNSHQGLRETTYSTLTKPLPLQTSPISI